MHLSTYAAVARSALALMLALPLAPSHAFAYGDSEQSEGEAVRGFQKRIPYEPNPHRDLWVLTQNGTTVCSRRAARMLATALLISGKAHYTSVRNTFLNTGACYQMGLVPFMPTKEPELVGKVRDDGEDVPLIVLTSTTSEAFTETNEAVGTIVSVRYESWFVLCWVDSNEMKHCF